MAGPGPSALHRPDTAMTTLARKVLVTLSAATLQVLDAACRPRSRSVLIDAMLIRHRRELAALASALDVGRK